MVSSKPSRPRTAIAALPEASASGAADARSSARARKKASFFHVVSFVAFSQHHVHWGSDRYGNFIIGFQTCGYIHGAQSTMPSTADTSTVTKSLDVSAGVVKRHVGTRRKPFAVSGA